MIKRALNLLVALKSFVAVVRKPERLDEVIKVVDRISNPDLAREVRERNSGDPQIARAFETQVRLGQLDVRSLLGLPAGTLGRVLADFLIKMNLDPADLPYRPNGDPATETEKYLVAHLYETHDLWHVTTGFETDVAGEAGLQAFYLAQMGLPLAGVLLAAILLNSAFFARDDFKRRMNAIATGWKMGRQSKALFGLPWRALMDRPLAEVRRSLGIVQDESCTWIAADYQIA